MIGSICLGQVVHMNEQMPAGDVSTGLGWAYLLNYLGIQLGGNFVQLFFELLALSENS